jgi:hypothetical protein
MQATQTLPQHSPVVQVPQSVPTTEISQAELIDLIEARNVLAQLKEKVAGLESGIKARLEYGASVQTGVHVAELKENLRRNVAWREVAERLGDRLYGDGKGEPYCDKVLSSTKPTCTVSLTVR